MARMATSVLRVIPRHLHILGEKLWTRCWRISAGIAMRQRFLFSRRTAKAFFAAIASRKRVCRAHLRQESRRSISTHDEMIMSGFPHSGHWDAIDRYCWPGI